MTGLSRRRFMAAATAVAVLPASLPRIARAQDANRRRMLRIGVLNDMSGSYSDMSGPTSAICVRQAVEEFAAQGFTVEVLVADHQNQPDIGAGIARQWFDRDGIDAILDVPTTAVALAVNHIAKERNKTYLNCGSTTSDLTGKDCTPNTIHWGYDNVMLGSTIGKTVTRAGGDKWFFLTVNHLSGQQVQDITASYVAANGGKLVGAVKYPFGSSDFATFLLLAQTSGANVIGLANAGDDTVNCVKQAHEFGLTSSGIKIAAVAGNITVAHGIGLELAQGIIMCESFYWDLNDRTRAFAKRTFPKTPKNMMNSIHASCYASTLHYLKTMATIGLDRKDDGAVVIASMKEMPTDDDCFGKASIRADGRVMLTPYLLEVKKPVESHSEWDLFKVLENIPAEEAALPLQACPMFR
ncbi:ABC transporter substrate-binding protein [Azospirillum endophyticum]